MLSKTDLIKITSIILITTFVLATVFVFSINTENSFSIKSTKVEVKAILEPNTNFKIIGTSTTKDSINDLVVVGEVKNNPQEEKQLVQLIITVYYKNNNILTTDITYTHNQTIYKQDNLDHL
jgi:hypothetical protein